MGRGRGRATRGISWCQVSVNSLQKHAYAIYFDVYGCKMTILFSELNMNFFVCVECV